MTAGSRSVKPRWPPPTPLRGSEWQSTNRQLAPTIAARKYRAAGGQYGQLVNLNFEAMRAGERVRSDDYAKESIADFALWKSRVPEDGQVFWPSAFGEGRPGWHLVETAEHPHSEIPMTRQVRDRELGLTVVPRVSLSS